MSLRSYKISGLVLTTAAVIGFLTVADDLRHTGEFFGVLGLLVSGLAFLAAGFFPRGSSVLALQWIPAGLLPGLLAGAATDKVVIGVCSGMLAGLLIARLRRDRPT